MNVQHEPSMGTLAPAPRTAAPEQAPQPAAKQELRSASVDRLVSLDILRGLTIAGMILVNNPGDWGHVYGPLQHAAWHGLTPTDLVFPFFLFIVGAAMPFSFDKRLAAGGSRARLFGHVLRRSAILFALGMILNAFPGLPQPRLGGSLALPRSTPPASLYDWDGWRLLVPPIALIIGLALLFADQPTLRWPRTHTGRIRKTLAWLVLAGAVAFFALDFGYFQDRQPPVRVPGVLQRIAVCYLLASLIVLLTSFRRRRAATAARFAVIVALLAGYWALVKPASFGLEPLIAPPTEHRMENAASRPEGVLHDWIDVQFLGTHLYRERPDPEGILSTLPAIATVLFGVFAGTWLRRRPDPAVGELACAETASAPIARQPGQTAVDPYGCHKAGWLFVAANVLLILGLWMGWEFPLNKKIWTSSYVVVTAGIALSLLGVCYWIVDVQQYRRWALPFLVLGTNAIAVYFASGIGARLLGTYMIPCGTDAAAAGTGMISLKAWIYAKLTEWLAHFPPGMPGAGHPEVNASLLYALGYVALWCVLFVPLYRLRVFIRI